MQPNKLENIRLEFTCPVSLELLTECTTLIPCAHKVQEAVSRMMFGSSRAGVCTIRNVPCPLCKVPITGYLTDNMVRSATQALFGSDKIEGLLSEECKKAEMEPVELLPYPGKPAKFLHSNGTWENVETGLDLCRCIELRSLITDSFIKEFSILGYKNGSFAIFIEISDDKTLRNQSPGYFNAIGISTDNLHLTNLGHLEVKNLDQIRILFSILSKNNEFPEPYLSQIKQIIDKGLI